MWCLHYPKCITTNSWHLVDTQLTVNFRMGPGPYNLLFCQWWLAIRWLCIIVSKSLTNYLNKRPNFVEAPLALIFRMGKWPFRLLFWQQRLPICWLHVIESISSSNHHTYITKYNWRSVDAQLKLVVASTLTILLTKAAKRLVSIKNVAQLMDYTTCNTQNCWRSFDALVTLIFRCSEIDSNHIFPQGGHYFDYW